MPVWKSHSFEEARRALWLSPEDENLLARMSRLAAMARAPRGVQRGVTRCRTLEEARRRKGAHWQVRPDLLP